MSLQVCSTVQFHTLRFKLSHSNTCCTPTHFNTTTTAPLAHLLAVFMPSVRASFKTYDIVSILSHTSDNQTIHFHRHNPRRRIACVVTTTSRNEPIDVHLGSDLNSSWFGDRIKLLNESEKHLEILSPTRYNIILFAITQRHKLVIMSHARPEKKFLLST